MMAKEAMGRGLRAVFRFPSPIAHRPIAHSQMRVIAGSLKGRRLEAPRWEGLRPTSDRLRETLFNVLAPVIEGARVIDGYAGTGAVGIEALSRGAAHVTFIEQDMRAVRLIEIEPCALRCEGPLCYYPRGVCGRSATAGGGAGERHLSRPAVRPGRAQ